MIFDLRSVAERKPIGDPTIDTVICNLGPQINRHIALMLKRHGNLRATHAGMNFNGQVWFEKGLWHEVIFQYHQPVGYMVARKLIELFKKVNDEYGWE